MLLTQIILLGVCA